VEDSLCEELHLVGGEGKGILPDGPTLQEMETSEFEVDLTNIVKHEIKKKGPSVRRPYKEVFISEGGVWLSQRTMSSRRKKKSEVKGSKKGEFLTVDRVVDKNQAEPGKGGRGYIGGIF